MITFYFSARCIHSYPNAPLPNAAITFIMVQGGVWDINYPNYIWSWRVLSVYKRHLLNLSVLLLMVHFAGGNLHTKLKLAAQEFKRHSRTYKESARYKNLWRPNLSLSLSLSVVICFLAGFISNSFYILLYLGPFFQLLILWVYSSEILSNIFILRSPLGNFHSIIPSIISFRNPSCLRMCPIFRAWY